MKLNRLHTWLLLFCYCCLILPPVYAQSTGEERYHFNHLLVEDGLSQSTVFSIYKDQKNFMWFGTRRGLNRYDGYSFTHFMHHVHDSTSLSSNIIFAIIGDVQDNLIIQTENAVNYFDRQDEAFKMIKSDQVFHKFVKDRKGDIWACSDSGIYIFNKKQMSFDHVKTIPNITGCYNLTVDDENTIWVTGKYGVMKLYPQTMAAEPCSIHSFEKEDPLYFIEKDWEGRIWLCSQNGALWKYQVTDSVFKKITYNGSSDNKYVTSFGCGFNQSIFIGTDGDGLICFYPEFNRTQFYNHEPDEKESLSGNTIYSMYSDGNEQVLWFGSYMGGLDYYSQEVLSIRLLQHMPYNPKSIINNNIRSLYVDANDNIWTGTRQGITVLDSVNVPIIHLTSGDLQKKGVNNPIITRLWQDPKGYIWICTYKGGVILFDTQQYRLVDVKTIYPRINLPTNIGVFDVLLDSKGNFWFATDEGTYLFPVNKKGFVFHPDFSKDVLEDRAGRIFIGTSYNGLLMVDQVSLKVAPVTIKNANENENENVSRINTLFEDSEGDIWIGTGGGGIIRYVPMNGSHEQYSTIHGLPDNHIAGISQDKNNIYWITTYSGLSRFIPSTSKFKQVYLENNIKGKEFNPNSLAFSKKGLLYAGSINGLLVFNTNTYRENKRIPNVVFTDFFVNNEKVDLLNNKQGVSGNQQELNKITLKYDQNSIGLNFTAPIYHLGNKVTFFYRFGNKDTVWTDIGNNRMIHFVNLDPGNYQLEVKAENAYGYSNSSGTSLFIKILPPLWRTSFAYIFYFISCLMLLLVFRRISKSKMNLKYQVLLQKKEKDKQEEINQNRIKLFTDISHEIGTSLTLINIPLETLSKIEDDPLKKRQLETINKNVSRLMLLVKKIIGLRKVETGNAPLMAERDDIIDFVSSICSIFESLAQNRKINFLIDIPKEPLESWFDKEKLEFILYNLLSNAFKHEPNNGTVWISLIKTNRRLKEINRKVISISVGNAGSYIPESKINDVFERFYTSNENKFGYEIGLNLVKWYTEIHKGEIKLSSTEENGVVFELTIPYGESYLDKNEKKWSNSVYESKSYLYISAEQEQDFTDNIQQNHEGIKIIIIENNVELKKILKDQLKSKYEIIEAVRGDEALVKIKNFLPDLVIADMESDVNNGLEVCAMIKKDLETGHIPVIVLGSNDDIEEQIKTMESGADAYIAKPFSMNYLNSLIINLLEIRKKLKYKYYLGSGKGTDTIEISSVNENFMEKAYRIMEENLDNNQFGIPEFIDQLGVSRYMLYNKIKELTGQTPNDFMISYRLNKAAEILKRKEISDVDVYEKLGFNDVSYFRKCFKKHYGMTPVQFVKAHLLKS